MQVRFVLGPAGSGKTFGCLSEARQALAASPEGLPMVLLAPKQGTYQLEQQLLATASLAGYTRLSILSFESLARFVFDRLGQPPPAVLSEEGRLMVLRSLLARHRDQLKLFRASARLTGFAQQLSEILTELERAGLTPSALAQVASGIRGDDGLRLKLEDFALLLGEYLRWLDGRRLSDQQALLKQSVECLRATKNDSFALQSLWVDGFAEFGELELDLLTALLPRCQRATLTFCLEHLPPEKASWLSHWSVIERNFHKCRKRLAGSGLAVQIVRLPNGSPESRFSKNPILRHLEECWNDPRGYDQPANRPGEIPLPEGTIRLAECMDPSAEVVTAAREILQFVRTGGRYRDISVLVRHLDPYQQLIQRVFTRYEIPFFLDRRQSVCHHPAAELTRSAVRLIAFGWETEDWFAALKSGLVSLSQEAVDLLENEALARGWRGENWLRPIELKDVPRHELDRQRLEMLARELEQTRRLATPPFEHLGATLALSRNQPTGPQLAEALRRFWAELRVEEQLEAWPHDELSQPASLLSPSVHQTVWRQMNAWLDNAALAFPSEPLSLREWLPILEAGLANLTVGIIPPALDQVLIGAVDRSRTPEVKLALVLGLNEGVFPAKPQSGGLLTETDRLQLERHSVSLGADIRVQLGRERFLGYIACTRARERLVLTWACSDSAGTPCNSSSFISHVRQLFPELHPAKPSPQLELHEIAHSAELVEILARDQTQALTGLLRADLSWLESVPGVVSLAHSIQQFMPAISDDTLDPCLAGRLYGPVLRTSVSRMEQFAACPFRFFVHSGLRAEERKFFELDIKEQGTFQHDALALFHTSLQMAGKRWRDITPQEARAQMSRIASGLLTNFRDGLLQASEQGRFTGRVLTESLQDFVETLVEWMREQYQFDPVAVELPFGAEEGAPAWALDLGGGKRLELQGRIDRVDIYREAKRNAALCVVVDYKSSQKRLDPLFVSHGLQLQLLSYLNVLRQWPDPQASFGVQRLDPAGVFYVSLRGHYTSERNRTEALAQPEQARKMAYRHSGRFDVRALPHLDSRANQSSGDQFNYRLTGTGRVHKGSKEALSAGAFAALLQGAENTLRLMGQLVFDGRVEVGPYRKGLMTACDQCSYRAICRIDPWTHRFRVLSPAPQASSQAREPEDALP